ncbi:hypothetical protein Egran_06805 [Elaphomyces granulatus]|uniref:Pyridoxamine 5'-phosphate oxidase putative domain-containing protein n=1 Tax=Elaphomyces granulatus TaxID=519963 RepID=A0A232LNN6_9EURO|nr:hypothetical protein Egran_06805 [Elaphomyces granulatus]
MADSTNPPLSYEPSATTTHPHIATSLPPEVVSCLKNSRFMTTNPASRKMTHLLVNPRVSLLVHDWVSHRPPTRAPNPAGAREGSPPPAATRSSLANLLLTLNTSALSSISTTITSTARFVECGSEEERWCKDRHLENNTFASASEEDGLPFGQSRRDSGAGECPSIGDTVRVVTVRVQEGRIADWRGGVRDWILVSGGEEQEARARAGLVNGITPHS